MTNIILTPDHQYITPAGILPSVTTILAQTETEKAKERLRKWQQKFNSLEGISNESSAASARDRGTLLHNTISSYLDQEETIIDPSIAILWEQAHTVLKSVSPVSWERYVYHGNLRYAGTLDLLAIDSEGRLTLIEWKTSYRRKRKAWIENHWLQCAAYTTAYEWMYDEKIERNWVVILNPSGLQVFKCDKGEIVGNNEKWLSRLGQYYSDLDEDNLASSLA